LILVSIDHDGPVPVYRQLADILREAIARGDYPPGRPIPSENRLAQEHDLARVTVRKAIRLLMDEGLVQGVQGRGVYVTDRS
jgi:GntR family transcriptional regulator